jgi:hypothetical protein
VATLSREGYITHDGNCYKAEEHTTHNRKPDLATQLANEDGELHLLCCHQDKQTPERLIPGGKLIVTFPDWEGENKVFLGETFEDGWVLSFANKKLCRG